MLPINTVVEDQSLDCYVMSQVVAPPPLEASETLEGITIYINTNTKLTSFPSGNVLADCDDIDCLVPGPQGGQYCNPHIVIREDINMSSMILLEIDIDGFDVCSVADPEPDLQDCVMEVENEEYSPEVEYLYNNSTGDNLRSVIQTDAYSPQPPSPLIQPTSLPPSSPP